MPLPEIIIESKDFKKEYLYKLSNWFGDCKKLANNDNEKYNEPLEESFHEGPYTSGYLDYSYADIHYEMVYQLAKMYDMNLYHVAKLLKDIDLHEKIKTYYESNTTFFEKQTKEYQKLAKVNKKKRVF